MASFCLDTSFLVGAWVRSYPPDVFPGLWTALDALIEAGEVVSPEEVLNELSAKEDDLHEWAQGRPALFAQLDHAQMEATTAILGDYPRLVGELADRNRADPFVIALAVVRGLTVVTEERGGSDKRPKIPFVCGGVAIPCIDTLGFIRAQGLSF
ncbi:DUF4411 family protein [Baekduia soli]|uniref:DUF4411 family protein n=1 Tax=Baekduia soli TaxID=496014 RepID=A0A5B8U4H7_9ACTN|nr:DUF4411 family protein [Baekduia soli]QEC47851.1 DUF4411 family protein [Baekduia soli]